MVRIVHYINQFFAGIGGEDSASAGPALVEGPVGPGRRLADLLAPDHEVVATVWCGDDAAPTMAERIVELALTVQPDLIVAGPAFTSGRYGLSCARVAAAAQASGVSAIASMHEDNPGLDEAGSAPVVASGPVARHMAASLDRVAGAVRQLAGGATLTASDGRIGRLARRSVTAEARSATRAIDLALARLGGVDAAGDAGGHAAGDAGGHAASEIPLPRFDRVTPAPPVDDASEVIIALLTEGALVPEGNPGGLESARATKWLRYPLGDALAPGENTSVHGGFSTVWANQDPHRIVPLDQARQLEAEGEIGSLFGEYFVTAGNGTSVANAVSFGIEWAADLRRSGVRAAILTAT